MVWGVFSELVDDGNLFNGLHQDLVEPFNTTKLKVPSPTHTKLTDLEKHPLADRMGPIALSLAQALELAGTDGLPYLHSLISLLDQVQLAWADIPAVRSPFGAGDDLVDEAAKRLVFAIVGLLAGPTNVCVQHASGPLAKAVVEVWAKLYFLTRRFGPGGRLIPSCHQLWDGIVGGLKKLEGEELVEIVESLRGQRYLSRCVCGCV